MSIMSRTCPDNTCPDNYKTQIRDRVWARLTAVAKPDSRFHYDFSEFIADFELSSIAVEKVIQLPCYQSAKVIFITPDNCLEQLRFAALRAGKVVLTTTYAIKRGFKRLDPSLIPPSRYEYASTLDGMEKLATPMNLVGISFQVDLLVTGTGAINTEGVRFGKGHGFFDLEWGMLYTIGAVSQQTCTVAIVHDCQILDERLVPEVFDTVCDIIATPSQIIEVPATKKPTCGILWDRLAEGMLESIPPLRELKKLLTLRDKVQTNAW